MISYAILNGNISNTWKFVILTGYVSPTLFGDLGISSSNIIHYIHPETVLSWILLFQTLTQLINILSR